MGLPAQVTFLCLFYRFFPIAAAIKGVITVMVEASKGKGRHPSSKTVFDVD